MKQLIGETKNNFITTQITEEGSYNVYVKAVNNLGKEGVEVSKNFSVSLSPSAPLNLVVNQNTSKVTEVNLSWDKSVDKDVIGYEVAVNDNWTIKSLTNFVTYTFPSDSVSTTYNFKVRALNNAGFSSSSIGVNKALTFEPSSVTNFSISNNSKDRRNLLMTWTPCSSLDFNHYVLKEGTVWDTATLISDSIKTPFYNDYYASSAGNKSFLIKAVNNEGRESSVSLFSVTVSLSPTTPSLPDSPEVPFRVDINDKTSVILKWKSISDLDLTGYLVYKNGTLLTETLSNSYTDKILADGIYTYIVCSKNIGGYTSSALTLFNGELSIEPSDIPSSSFTVAQDVTNRKIIKFAWDKVSDTDVAYYEIRLGSAWSTASLVATNIKSNYYDLTTTADNYTIFEGTNTYLVKAINSSGIESKNSASVNGTIDFRPTKPISGNITPSLFNRFSLSITWDRVSDLDLDYYEVSYTNSSGVTTTIYKGKENNLKYDVIDNGTLTFKVKTANYAGYYYSQELVLSTTINIYPSNVTNFVVTQNSLDKRVINLNWTKITDTDFSYYEIRKGNTWDTASVIVTNLKDNFYSYSVTSGEVGASYLIKAFNSGGVGSQTETSYSINIDIKPTKPTNGIAVNDSTNKQNIIISWTGISDTDFICYEIYNGAVLLGTTKENKYIYTAEDMNIISYAFNVYAKNLGGQYSDSCIINFSAGFTPSIVQNVHAVQSTSDPTKITISWDAVTDKDLAYYVVKRGVSWTDTNAITYTGITSTFYVDTIPTDAEREYTWFVKAVNKSGLESSDPSQPFETIFSLTPSNPSSVAVKQSEYDKSIVYIAWQGINQEDLKYYELRYGVNWDTATTILQTKETIVTWYPTKSGEYTFFVRAFNNAGFCSSQASSTVAIKLEPNDVTTFKALQSGDKILLTWDKSTEADVLTYEIREGSNFTNGTIIATGVSTNSYYVEAQMEITRMFHIKCVNKSGRYSENATSTSITVRYLPEKNVVEEFSEIPEYYMTFDNSTRIDIPEIPSGSQATTYSVSGWFLPTNSSGSSIFCGFGTSSSNTSNIFYDPTTKTFGFNHYNSDTYGFLNADSLLFDGKWHHIVAEFVSGATTQCKIYIDSNLKSLSQVKGGTTNRTLVNTLHIAHSIPIIDGYCFEGEIKKVSLFNRSLTVEEVRGIFKEGTLPSNGLIAYWKFEEGEGTTINDNQGLLDGTVVGTATWNMDVDGTGTNTEFGESNVNCGNIGLYTGKYRASDFKDEYSYPTMRCNEFGTNLVLKLAIDQATGGYYPTGEFIINAKDMGQVITANIASHFVSTILANIGLGAKLLYRTSTDNTLWTPWKDFVAITTTFRYIQFKVSLYTDDTSQTPEVPILKNVIDVPDTDKSGKIYIPNEGIDVYYDPYTLAQIYYESPDVLATSAEIGKYVVVSGIDKDKFHLNMYNISNNSSTTGYCNWVSKGY